MVEEETGYFVSSSFKQGSVKCEKQRCLEPYLISNNPFNSRFKSEKKNIYIYTEREREREREDEVKII